jgi:phosphoribosyl-ATP pyrophosphohydrolase/phosphoribosyl-AMP cyclohydrolase
LSGSKLSFLTVLEEIIVERKNLPSEGSYTSELFAAGRQRIAQKVGEEAVEVILASASGNREATVNETADLLYHLLVLLTEQGIRLSDVVDTLEQRHTGN